jgi:hypothetical protein
MVNWAYVENNTIVETFDCLPKNYRNISNLDACESDLLFLKTNGWYKVQRDNIEHDPSTQIIRYGNLTFDGDKVTEPIEIENISSNDLFNSFINSVRELRNKLLQESDFLCLCDLVTKNGEQYLNDVTDYRQQLRDFPNLFENDGTIYNLTTIKWPIKPDYK